MRTNVDQPEPEGSRGPAEQPRGDRAGVQDSAANEPVVSTPGLRLADVPPDAGTEFRPDDSFYRVEAGWVSLRRLGGIITVMVIWGTMALVLAILTFGIDLPPTLRNWLWIGWALTNLGFSILALVWPARAYRHYMYRVDQVRLEIRRGYFWRSVHDVPRNRIQHIDVGQGPIERMFELTHVVIHTAGSTSASVKIDGLREPVATAVRDVLLVDRGDDAV